MPKTRRPDRPSLSIRRVTCSRAPALALDSIPDDRNRRHPQTGCAARRGDGHLDARHARAANVRVGVPANAGAAAQLSRACSAIKPRIAWDRWPQPLLGRQDHGHRRRRRHRGSVGAALQGVRHDSLRDFQFAAAGPTASMKYCRATNCSAAPPLADFLVLIVPAHAQTENLVDAAVLSA